jgi:D-3-phosphoglycerate dehydrogenase
MKTYYLEEKFLGKEHREQLEKSFRDAGHEIVFCAFQTPGDVVNQAKDANALLSMTIPLDGKVMDALPGLKFIGRCGVGYDSVDIEAAADRGVAVCNVPDYCSYEVANLAFTLMLAIERQLLPFIARARAGGYAQGPDIKCRRIKGQKLGILGFGRIGRELAKMALGIGMEVLVFDPYVKELNESGIRLVTNLEEILKTADVISVHSPLTPETAHLISMPQLKMMKNSAIILNVSRGGIINTPDLIAALKTGVIAAAGLDVCEGEPLPADHELLSMPNVIFTPHVGMYSEEAIADMYFKLAAQAVDVLEGRWTKNVVNPRVKDIAKLK